MPRPLRKPVRCPFKPLLDRDHVARGKALLPLPVLPQRHQLGRGAHRAHRLVELLLAVAVAVCKHRKVADGERRLLARDRIERDSRLGDDLRAILARDADMIVGPLGILAAQPGTVYGGSWSEHIYDWAPERRERTLLIRFENLVTRPEIEIERISQFLCMEPRSSRVMTFEALNNAFPQSFRSGSDERNVRELEESGCLDLFWRWHTPMMVRLGYAQA